METDSYSANQRRAINLVWTACGDYQFEPQFLALKADGTPDFYMNCVFGLVRKWLGDEMPRRLFALWADDTRRSAFDDLAWLALENAVYEKELPVRPVLAELRRAHAAEFFASEYQLSRQEWMDKNQLVYSLQSARWRSVLGQKPPLLAPWEKGLSEALACPGTLDADELEAAVRAAFEKYLQFDGTPHKKSPFRLHFSDRWAPLLTKLLPVEIVRTDELTVGRSAVAGENGMVRASNALRAQLRSNEREAEDHDYIERCFGRSLYSPQALARIAQRCCTGDHLGCHLWFTRGERVPGQPMRTDTQRLFEQAAEQAKRNRAAYVRDSALHQNALLRLTEQIRNCMLIHQQPEDILAREGRLDGTRVWRAPVLHDSRVFLRKDEESRAGFTVDLMLDASASRLHCQESIAIQGYHLAKSLVSCGIPVRVTGFCNQRNNTVLRVLKDFGDKNGEHRVFDYFAAGWNRDGLALRVLDGLRDAAPLALDVGEGLLVLVVGRLQLLEGFLVIVAVGSPRHPRTVLHPKDAAADPVAGDVVLPHAAPLTLRVEVGLRLRDLLFEAALLFQQGQDVAIDQGLHEQSALHVGKHADKNADDDRNDLNAAAFHHIAQDAHEDLAGVLDFGARAAGTTAANLNHFCFLLSHSYRLPFRQSRRSLWSGCYKLPDRWGWWPAFRPGYRNH